MFLIKRNQAPSVQLYVPPAESPDEAPPRLNEIRVSFSKQAVAYYDKDALLQLDFFKLALGTEMQEAKVRVFDFPEMDKDIFNTMIAFVVEKKSLFDILSEESFYDPHLYENLNKCLTFLHLRECAPLLQQIEEQLRCMPLPIAYRVYHSYEDLKKTEEADKPIPLFAQYAKSCVYKSKVFNTLEEAEAHFADEMVIEEELRTCQHVLDSLLPELTTCRQQVKIDIINSQIDHLRDTIKWFSYKLKSLREITDYLSPKFPLSLSLNLARHIQDPDPELATLAASALARVQKYESDVLSALKGCGADLTRTDLLPYIIGPKAFLFDHWGFSLFNSRDPKFPFIVEKVGVFSFTLENDGPQDLEEEIRMNLGRNERNPHKPRLIDNFEKTKPMTPELSALREFILPILDKGASATEEEMVQVKQRLIAHNGWDLYEITPADIEFVSLGSYPDIESGKLNKWGRSRVFIMKKIDFLLRLDTQSAGERCMPNRITNGIDLETKLTHQSRLRQLVAL